MPARPFTRPASRALIVALGVLPGLLIGAAPARAQYAWAQVENQAVAEMTAPDKSDGFVTGGRLSCEHQKWTMTLDTVVDALLPDTGEATLTIDKRGDFTGDYTSRPGKVDISVPHEAIEALMARVRLEITLSSVEEKTGFALRGSKSAISAAQELCSPRIVEGANQLVLTPYSSYLNLARELLADDIKAFTFVTKADPKVTAAMVDLDGARHLLFVQLCGSYWYFGDSGCNISGFAQDGVDAEWKQVYDAEGLFLFVDPQKTTNGWPDITGIPLKQGYDELRWVWDGEAYAFVDQAENGEETGDGVAEGD